MVNHNMNIELIYNNIINQIFNSIDFGCIFTINILTYSIIKIIDEINKEKIVTVWQKRTIFIISAIIISIIYYFATDISNIIIINSCIVAPISWSWLIKPITKKFKIDYKKDIKHE